MANELAVRGALSVDSIDLIKRTIAKGATDEELALFVHHCNRTGLDPFAKQIFAVKRWNAKERREEMAIQTSIDGYRLIAERTEKYEGSEVFWCGEDGNWKDVWLSKTPPAAAKCVVYKTGARVSFTGVAHWDEYAQYTKEGGLTSFWKTKPALMLAKCAESQALRRAFPQELSGLYTAEEMPEAAPYVESTARVINEDTGELEPVPASEVRIKHMHAKGTEVFGKEWRDGIGRKFTQDITGKESTKGISAAEVEAIVAALKDDETVAKYLPEPESESGPTVHVEEVVTVADAVPLPF